MSWTPHHPGDASNERPRADELFAELSRIDSAPDELTARVMGQVGYRPVTTLEVGRRRRRNLIVRSAAFGLTTVALAAAAMHLRSTEGRHVDPVTVDAAVARDVTNVRTRVASAWTGLRRLAPVEPMNDAGAEVAAPPRPGTPAAMLAREAREADESGVDELPRDVRDLFADFGAAGPAESAPRLLDHELAPPTPRFGPAGFPSGGRGIDRLGPVWLMPGELGSPAGGGLLPAAEDARLGPFTWADGDELEWRA